MLRAWSVSYYDSDTSSKQSFVSLGQWTTDESVCVDLDATSNDRPGEEHLGPQTNLYNGTAQCCDEPDSNCDEPDWVFRYDG